MDSLTMYKKAPYRPSEIAWANRKVFTGDYYECLQHARDTGGNWYFDEDSISKWKGERYSVCDDEGRFYYLPEMKELEMVRQARYACMLLDGFEQQNMVVDALLRRMIELENFLSQYKDKDFA